ncbi:hypothetical protein [Egicoccus halophilus]|uniref:Thioredoxin domain-containing protein n=1 Tax=Egicoccus halophilus TaxID=1670830 RepID=A0A8J3AH45_9ACTN|nr:hypothetical protein [Egicoccus halophilus]GGI09056.1 hypothetical protein GCM10011354_32170 [Egicoccus halophilus]
MMVVVVLLAVVVAVQTVLVVGLLRSHAEILRRLHELGAGIDPDQPAGAPASSGAPTAAVAAPATPVDGRLADDVVGVGPDGEVLALRVREVRHDTVLVFLSSTCAGCKPYWPALEAPDVPGDTRVVVVTREEPDEDRDAIARLAPPGATVVMSDATWDAHDVPGSPYVVHVDGATGRVRGEGTAGTWPAVRRLLLQGAAGRDKAAADARRERDADRHLLAAGIEPGDPSLYRRAEQFAPGDEVTVGGAGAPAAGDDTGTRP